MIDGRIALAVELGLTVTSFGGWRWAPGAPGGQPPGEWIFEQRIYWVREGLFHSGPFTQLEEALFFLTERYGRALD